MCGNVVTCARDEAVSEVFGGMASITVAKVTMRVKNFHCSKAAGVDDIWPEMSLGKV